MSATLGQIGHSLAAAGFVILALIYLKWGQWGRPGYAFLAASLITAAWAAATLAQPWLSGLPYLVDLLHHAASFAWLLFLWLLISLLART